MYLYQISHNEILALVSKSMFNLNKIRGHLKMLELEKLKLTRYAEEATRFEVRNPKREADIARALRRVSGSIDLWTTKLDALTAAPPRPPERPGIISGPDIPLIS
jgi:hypothetical protein